ncbi:putative RNA-directed DNA polymerase, eukaryota, reverse transcriptase zinc-binding domain protein [Tanacetum coccineum]|uniref:RNA-directed DNA polymerase, eukaryota, reverse transcriptase zinc-binding domain protein n=1 Tax=Tanacetum coccineum TaxID=301880 RepID=A0ABQ5G7U9_9ASTR
MLISPNQSAFVPDRRISDNILLTQELMHNYHLDRGSPRCAFKIDIQKAYDTVDWVFLKQVLLAFGFHEKMVSWIMECVTTTTFSVSINGNLHGYFKGKRGLRQGDPMSPYLFTLIMEVFTLMLKRKVRDSHEFTYHRYCADLELINLCFADDLFIFAHGDQFSAKIIMEAMEEFKNASGLVPSLPKSTAYFCNVLNHTKLAILQILPFEEGRLPVKYLGVPLVSSRLVFRDCKELIDRLRSRINDWKNKSLSAAGRLQLVRSVLGSMHVYWASVFILPSQIILDIEQLMRGFLWCHGDMNRGKAKVSWEVVCLPKNEGGLGIRRLEIFNKALMVPHIWNLLSRKDSLWVKWIHVYKLRGRHFFDIPYRGCMTWGWRKLLQLRPLIRDYIWVRIGNGSTCSLWFDKWSSTQYLADIVSCRDIHRAGFTLSSKVNDAIHDGEWSWPDEWFSKYPTLTSIAVPMLSDVEDKLEWHNSMGELKHFSVREIWNSIRPRSDVVDWYNVVWFPNCIPSHAFHLWLVAKRRLKTQDRLRPWDLIGNTMPVSCLLCDGPPDSHDHLFYDCVFSKQVWYELKDLAGLPNVIGSISSIVNVLIPIAKRRTIRSVIAKLVVAASSYYIWQERNSRLFTKKKRTHGQLTECIKSSIRLKLLSCVFKKSKDALLFKRLWDIPNSSFR